MQSIIKKENKIEFKLMAMIWEVKDIQYPCKHIKGICTKDIERLLEITPITPNIRGALMQGYYWLRVGWTAHNEKG